MFPETLTAALEKLQDAKTQAEAAVDAKLVSHDAAVSAAQAETQAIELATLAVQEFEAARQTAHAAIDAAYPSFPAVP